MDISASLEDWGPGHPDRPLSFRWKVDYETLSRMLDLPACKSRRGERAMASIVYDAALSAREDTQRRISYSRRKAYYVATGRYEGTDYGYDTVVPAVDALVEAGLLIDHNKVKGGPGGTGTQSSFRPAPGLADFVLPKPDYRVGEIIRLKDSNGSLVSYRDTERTTRDRRFLEAVNRHIANADIRLGHINGVRVDENAGAIFFPGFLQWLDEGFGDHIVYPRMNELYRVYNGSWALGGRFYGGWWQQVRGCDRRHLLIDGAETIELDYQMLHPKLLYAFAGQKLAGDAYTLDGWDRNVCKRAFNILLNASSYPQALHAILPHVYNNRRMAAALVADLKKHHAPVASFFHSGVGLRLQNVDAEMVRSVLRGLTSREGITVLPIHDSFVVEKKYQIALKTAMDEALARATSCVGDRPAVSKGWSGSYPHRGGRTVGGGVRDGSTVGQSEPTRPVDGHQIGALPNRVAPIAVGLWCGPDRSPISSAPTSETRNGAADQHGIATQPLQIRSSSGGETARVALPLSDTVSAARQPDTVVNRAFEGPQSDDRNLTHPVDPAICARTIAPPAFLSPANRSRILADELKRLAGRPLKERPTADQLGRRKLPR